MHPTLTLLCKCAKPIKFNSLLLFEEKVRVMLEDCRKETYYEPCDPEQNKMMK